MFAVDAVAHIDLHPAIARFPATALRIDHIKSETIVLGPKASSRHEVERPSGPSRMALRSVPKLILRLHRAHRRNRWWS